MIEVLKTRIEILSPEQRWLIAVNEEDIVFHVLCDIAARIGSRIIKIIPILPIKSIDISYISCLQMRSIPFKLK